LGLKPVLRRDRSASNLLSHKTVAMGQNFLNRGTEISPWLSQNPANGPRHEPFECNVQCRVILI